MDFQIYLLYIDKKTINFIFVGFQFAFFLFQALPFNPMSKKQDLFLSFFFL